MEKALDSSHECTTENMFQRIFYLQNTGMQALRLAKYDIKNTEQYDEMIKI